VDAFGYNEAHFSGIITTVYQSIALLMPLM